MQISIDNFINQLPDSVKEKTNIDELLQKLESAKDKEKLEIIKQIDEELDKLLNGDLKIEFSNQDKEKLEKIKKQLEQIKQNLEDLKKQVGQLPKKDIERLNYKVFTISEDIEEDGFDGEDENGITGFFRKILKWLESFLGGLPSSNGNISATFEKFGYGNKEDIEKVLKIIGDIRFKDLKDFYENLKNDDGLQVSLGKEKYYDNPFIPNFIEKFTDKFVNWTKSFFEDKITFENDKQKKIASYIVLTILINKDFFEKKEDNKVVHFIKEKTHFGDTPEGRVEDLTINDLLDKMFPHGLSDIFRNYALPAKGVKILDFKSFNDEAENADTKEDRDKRFKIDDYEIYFKPGSEIVVEKNGKKYKFVKLEFLGGIFKITLNDIRSIRLKGDKIIVKLKDGKTKSFTKEKAENILDKLDDNNLKINFNFGKIYFELV